MLENDIGSRRIDGAPTHQVIAERISSHREAVTREMRRLSRLGLLNYGRGYIEIIDGEAIRKLVRASGYY